MIGNQIRLLRKDQNWNQTYLAKQLNITQATIANYEKNIRQPNIEMIVKIADLFNVTTDYLFGKATPADSSNIWVYSQIKIADFFLDLLLNDQVDDASDFIKKYIDQFGQEWLFFKLFRNTLTKLGWLWEIEEITIAKEHQVSQLIETYIERTEFKPCKKLHKPRVVGMTLPFEKHTFGLKMLMKLLSKVGYETHYIGVGVPMNDFMMYIEEKQPEIIILSTTIPNLQQDLNLYFDLLKDYELIIVGMGVEHITTDKNIKMYKNYYRCMEALQ